MLYGKRLYGEGVLKLGRRFIGIEMDTDILKELLTVLNDAVIKQKNRQLRRFFILLTVTCGQCVDAKTMVPI
ncbi:hypothetical protein SVI_1160 [Shewanella violacea DSS12]|uniref:Uncharacterized protein n=1 Tax=Shewanella violacea (strain JCM 10179 / CIP 106290 / LMG 19151 / DSS12) TaxID=637905 RepID=D4ZHI2_SHEVD|nr:hypothetical protein SVI_1160 [Shewanella violacea DSS12]